MVIRHLNVCVQFASVLLRKKSDAVATNDRIISDDNVAHAIIGTVVPNSVLVKILIYDSSRKNAQNANNREGRERSHCKIVCS